jgi:hypothetical protein
MAVSPAKDQRGQGEALTGRAQIRFVKKGFESRVRQTSRVCAGDALAGIKRNGHGWNLSLSFRRRYVGSATMRWTQRDWEQRACQDALTGIEGQTSARKQRALDGAAKKDPNRALTSDIRQSPRRPPRGRATRRLKH